LKSFNPAIGVTNKGRNFRPLFYVLFLRFPTLAFAEDNQRLMLEFDSSSYSEASSLYSISGHWNDRVSSGTEAWSSSRLVLGYRRGAISIQSVFRDDSYYHFDNQTAQFIYQTENHLPLTINQHFRLDIEPDRISSKGIRLGYTAALKPELKVSAFISLLYPVRMTQGRLAGEAVALNSNDYDFNFATDLVYAVDPLFDRTTGQLSGRGYSVDVLFNYVWDDHWTVDLQLLDIAGEIVFDDAPYTRADATSSVKVYGEDGYLTYDPVISGIEGFRYYRYKFQMKTHLKLGYQFHNSNRVMLEHHRVFGFGYQKLIFEQHLESGQLSWKLIPALKAAGLSYRNKSFSIGVESDQLSTKKMKYLSLNASIYWSL